MSTLEERVLEAIEATGLKVPVLAEKIGVTVQSIYDWKKGKSLGDMKADNLIELAYLAGYEPRWIRKEKGLKKKAITKEQEAIIELSELMQEEARKNWMENGRFLTSITPTPKVVEEQQPKTLQSNKKSTGAAERITDPSGIMWDGKERRKTSVPVKHDRRIKEN